MESRHSEIAELDHEAEELAKRIEAGGYVEDVEKIKQQGINLEDKCKVQRATGLHYDRLEIFRDLTNVIIPCCFFFRK